MVKWLDAIIELLRQFAPSLAEWWSQRLQDRRERKDMERELREKHKKLQEQRQAEFDAAVGSGDAGGMLSGFDGVRKRKKP